MPTMKIPTTKGDLMVPYHEIEGCKHLCVTMTTFGTFEITHKLSGFKLSGSFERAISAVCEMLRFEIGLKEAGIVDELEKDDFKKAIKSSNTKSDCLSGMTLMEYAMLCRQLDLCSNEFPWESYEDSPFATAEELTRQLIGE